VSNGDIGDLYLEIGNRAAARRYFERSLAANTPVRFMYGRISVLWGLGRLETDEGRPAVAIQRLAEAMALADSGNWAGSDPRSGPRAPTPRWPRATPPMRCVGRRGAAPRRLDRRPRQQAARLQARAAALEALGRRAAADEYLEAIDLLESWRGRIALGDLRMSVAESYWRVYEGAIRALLARGEAMAAFTVAERAKARMLLELMAERERSRPAVSARAAQRERLRVLVEERGGARGDSARAVLDREIAAAIDSLQASSAASGPRRGRRRPAPHARGLATSRRSCRPAGRCSSSSGAKRDVYGWAITAGGVRRRQARRRRLARPVGRLPARDARVAGGR